MKTLHSLALVAAACSAAWAGIAGAQITTAAGVAPAGSNTVYLKRTETRFGGFAGSNTNADSLATGLRQSKPVTLTDGVEKVTFTPPTKPMGNGNVTRALDLAQRDLAAAGITEPTPAQIKIAMMGGEIVQTKGGVTTTTTFQGVLQLRSEGMGWGQIAHTIGVHPGMGKSAAVAAPVSGGAATGLGASGAKSGIVTAAGGSAGSNGNGHAYGRAGGAGSSGTVTTAAGVSAGASGVATANGHGQGNGNAYGRSK